MSSLVSPIAIIHYIHRRLPQRSSTLIQYLSQPKGRYEELELQSQGLAKSKVKGPEKKPEESQPHATSLKAQSREHQQR
jgi:hypothetical protein